MKKIAFIFPGQGSQFIGMGEDFARDYKIALETYEEASDILSVDMAGLCFNGPEADLIKTENAQPAILATTIAILRVLEQKGITAEIAAGLSLGEYSALVYVGAISFKDALKVVRNRGKYMQEAVPLGLGAMAAVKDLHIDKLRQVVLSAGDLGIVEIANHNSDEQIVISGELAAVKDAAKKAKQAGASRAVLLPVSAPFHCSLLKPAETKLAGDLSQIKISTPNIPVVSNVNAAVVTSKEEIVSNLIKQVSQTILWKDSVDHMINGGAEIFIEVGPKDTLTKFVKSIVINKGNKIETYNIGLIDDLEALLEDLSLSP